LIAVRIPQIPDPAVVDAPLLPMWGVARGREKRGGVMRVLGEGRMPAGPFGFLLAPAPLP
jgi:hypothetical protein